MPRTKVWRNANCRSSRLTCISSAYDKSKYIIRLFIHKRHLFHVRHDGSFENFGLVVQIIIIITIIFNVMYTGFERAYRIEAGKLSLRYILSKLRFTNTYFYTAHNVRGRYKCLLNSTQIYIISLTPDQLSLKFQKHTFWAPHVNWRLFYVSSWNQTNTFYINTVCIHFKQMNIQCVRFYETVDFKYGTRHAKHTA